LQLSTGEDLVTITVNNQQAITDILDIAIGEVPAALALVQAQTQQLLQQAQSIKTAIPQPAVKETV
jgi:hypothetical protein